MPRHLGVLSGVVKMSYEPCLEQTVHPSCTNTNTISKRTELRFHLSLVTEEFYRVWSKWFLSLVRHKSCTYLALILTLSPNGLKQASTWASSPSRTIGCVQNDFWAYGTKGLKPCTYLAPTLTLSPNGPKRDSTWVSSPRSSIGWGQNDFRALFGTNRAPILH